MSAPEASFPPRPPILMIPIDPDWAAMVITPWETNEAPLARVSVPPPPSATINVPALLQRDPAPVSRTEFPTESELVPISLEAVTRLPPLVTISVFEEPSRPTEKVAELLQREPAPLTITEFPEEVGTFPIIPFPEKINPPFEITSDTDLLLLPTVRSFPPVMDPVNTVVPPSRRVTPE